MNHVEFPGLGWSFDIKTTVFSIGSFQVKWYGLLIAVGFLLAVVYAMLMCKKMNINRSRLLDTVIVGLIAGIIGARLYYVIFYPGDKFLKDPISIFYIHEGGIGIYGGIIGALLIGAIFAKFRKLNVYATLDIAVLGFLIGQAIGRWGNFVNQEAFGGPTSMPWGMISENTLAISPDPVHPCFFYESLWCVLGFILLHIFTTKFRRYDGQTFLLYIIWYGTGRFFIEATRTDSLYVPFLPIKISQLVAVVSVLVGIALLIVFRNRKFLIGCGSKTIMALNTEQIANMEGVALYEVSERKEKKFKHIKNSERYETKKEEKSDLLEQKTDDNSGLADNSCHVVFSESLNKNIAQAEHDDIRNMTNKNKVEEHLVNSDNDDKNKGDH